MHPRKLLPASCLGEAILCLTAGGVSNSERNLRKDRHIRQAASEMPNYRQPQQFGICEAVPTHRGFRPPQAALRLHGGMVLPLRGDLQAETCPARL